MNPFPHKIVLFNRQDVDTLKGEDELIADHVSGVAAFTMETLTESGKPYSKHRFAMIVTSDRATAESLMLHPHEACEAMEGLRERFRELMTGIFGEEVVHRVVMAGLAERLEELMGSEDDDDDEDGKQITMVLN